MDEQNVEKITTDGNHHTGTGIRAIEKVKRDVKKPLSVLIDYAVPKVRVKEFDNTCRSFRCCMCGNTYVTQKGNFLKNDASPLWKGNNGYVPICKTCCEALFTMYTHLFDENEEHAMKQMCHLFDWYYSDIASAMTLSQVQKNGSRISLYPSKLGTRQVANKGSTYVDTLKDEQLERNRVMTVPTTSSDKKEEEEPYVVTRQTIRVWGPGYSPEQYEFLETEYEDWCNRTEVESKSQEELIRNICIAQLNIRIAQSNGGKTDVAQKALTDLMTNCNLTPRQKNEIANRTETQLSYGQLIKRIENEQPIGEPQDEFKDPDGIKKYINTFFFGHLAKALGLKNDNQDLYDQEMEKYKGYTDKTSQKEVSADDIFNKTENKDVEGDS